MEFSPLTMRRTTAPRDSSQNKQPAGRKKDEQRRRIAKKTVTFEHHPMESWLDSSSSDSSTTRHDDRSQSRSSRTPMTRSILRAAPAKQQGAIPPSSSSRVGSEYNPRLSDPAPPAEPYGDSDEDGRGPDPLRSKVILALLPQLDRASLQPLIDELRGMLKYTRQSYKQAEGDRAYATCIHLMEAHIERLVEQQQRLQTQLKDVSGTVNALVQSFEAQLADAKTKGNKAIMEGRKRKGKRRAIPEEEDGGWI